MVIILLILLVFNRWTVTISNIFKMYFKLILMLIILEFENDDKIKHRNIPENVNPLCLIFSGMRMFLFGLEFIFM